MDFSKHATPPPPPNTLERSIFDGDFEEARSIENAFLGVCW